MPLLLPGRGEVMGTTCSALGEGIAESPEHGMHR